MISTDVIKELRDKTGAGISDAKKALEASGGDSEKAMVWLERKLGSTALKKAGRETRAGLIEAYVHSTNRIAVLVEIFCETDFVSRNPAFKEFAHDIAMHIAATNPIYLSLDSIPEDVLRAEKSRAKEEVKGLEKPKHILDEIIDGKVKTYLGSLTLLTQPFVKDQDKAVEDIVKEAIGRFGENIKIGKFIRFEI